MIQMRGILFSALLLVMLAASPLKSQQGGEFRFYYSFDRFRWTDSLTYIEFNVGLQRDVLTYLQKEDNFLGEYVVEVKIHQDDSLTALKRWRNLDTIDSLGQVTAGLRLFFQNHLLVPTGKYDFTVRVSDPNSAKTLAYVSELEAEDWSADKLSISDIQLASYITRNDSMGEFTKNRYRVMPNPSRLYGLELPMLYSYMEIYNLTSGTDVSGSHYEVRYKVLDEDGQVVKAMAPKRRKKPGNTAVDINQISVVTLRSGAYAFVVQVEDLENGERTERQKRFFVYREGDFVGGKRVEEDAFVNMTEKQLDEEFEYASYIIAKAQQKIYRQGNTKGKQQFLRDFWAEMDSLHGHSVDDKSFREAYLERVDYSNEALKGRFREGWETDRGRVLLLYGKPSEIRRGAFGPNKNDHEVWHYWNIEGSSAEFIFVDKRGLGEMELVHSTARGEISDPGWTRHLGP
jgi:GWxTD domain-containing protein